MLSTIIFNSCGFKFNYLARLMKQISPSLLLKCWLVRSYPSSASFLLKADPLRLVSVIAPIAEEFPNSGRWHIFSIFRMRLLNK